MNIRRVNRQIRHRRQKTKNGIVSMTPKLAVFRSSKYTYGSIFDVTAGKTVLSGSSKTHSGEKKTKMEEAFDLGKALAGEAVKKGIKAVVFDRSGYLYHGRVKAVAEGAREGGLKF